MPSSLCGSVIAKRTFVIAYFRHCEAVCQNVQLPIKVPTAVAIPFFVPSFNETRLHLYSHQ